MSLGEKIGQACKGGEVFELRSDLGGGKTAFVRGLATGMGAIDDVSSPSFTINNTYTSPHLTLEHFDFYRLDQAGILADQLQEDIFHKDTVVAVEWGDIVSGVLPDAKVSVEISVDQNDSRTFSFLYQAKFQYLFEKLS